MTRSHETMRRTYADAILAAEGLLDPVAENRGSEYARGQVELIADLFSIPMDSREIIERELGLVETRPATDILRSLRRVIGDKWLADALDAGIRALEAAGDVAIDVDPANEAQAPELTPELASQLAALERRFNALRELEDGSDTMYASAFPLLRDIRRLRRESPSTSPAVTDLHARVVSWVDGSQPNDSQEN